MTILDFIQEFKSHLSNKYSEGELDQLIFLMIEDRLNFSRMDLSMRKNDVLSIEDHAALNSILEKLKLDEPIQYILGHAWFSGMKLKVNHDVLIPRQETEELVDWIIKECSNSKPFIVDICSGSGCIGLALKKNLPFSKVIGLDISDGAINISKQNSTDLNLVVEFYKKDILVDALEWKEIDVIVSNPPYIRKSESTLMKANVLEHEPHLALFVEDNDPLVFYKRIAILAKSSLKSGGKIYFEINENLSTETANILSQLGFQEILIRKDLNNRDRMIRAINP